MFQAICCGKFIFRTCRSCRCKELLRITSYNVCYTKLLRIGRAEAFASRNPPLLALFDGLMMGLGFALVLLVLGGVRELLGQGTLFDGAELLLGDWAAVLRIQVVQMDSGFLLAILPPGAFIALGFLIALKNSIDVRLLRRKAPERVEVARARTTTL